MELGHYPHAINQIPTNVVVTQPLTHSQVQAQTPTPTQLPTVPAISELFIENVAYFIECFCQLISTKFILSNGKICVK